MNVAINTTAMPERSMVVPSDLMDDINVDLATLGHVLEQAHIIMGDLDCYGVGADRNHELDRCAALVAVCRDMAQKIGESHNGIWRVRQLGEGSGDAKFASPEQLPSWMRPDYADWTILDFELAYETLLRIEHGISGLLAQPRSYCEPRGDYQPGMAIFRDMIEKWLDGEMNRLVKHLEKLRFDDPEDETRRQKAILRMALDYPDASITVDQLVASLGVAV